VTRLDELCRSIHYSGSHTSLPSGSAAPQPKSFVLSLLLLVPLIGAICVTLLPRSAGSTARRAALGFTIAQLAMLLWLAITGFDYSKGGVQFASEYSWIASMGFSIELVADGLSLLFLLSSSLLFGVAFLSRSGSEPNSRAFFILAQLCQACVACVLLASNLYLLIAAWQLLLLLIYFLLNAGADKKLGQAAVRYLMLSQACILGLGVGLAMYTMASGADGIEPSLNMFDLQSQAGSWDPNQPTLLGMQFPAWTLVLQFVCCLGLLGVFPLHRVGNQILRHCSPAVAIIFAGIATKLGAYALLRMVLPLAASVLPSASYWIALCGLVGLAYGARQLGQTPDLLGKMGQFQAALLAAFLIPLAASFDELSRSTRAEHLQVLAVAVLIVILHSMVISWMVLISHCYLRRDQDLNLALPKPADGNAADGRSLWQFSNGNRLLMALPVVVGVALMAMKGFAYSPWLSSLGALISLFLVAQALKAFNRLSPTTSSWRDDSQLSLSGSESKALLFMSWPALLVVGLYFFTEHILATLNVVLGTFTGGTF